MSWRSSLVRQARHAPTLGERACPGSNKRERKSREQNAAKKRHAKASVELQAGLGGSSLPPDIELPKPRRKHGR